MNSEMAFQLINKLHFFSEFSEEEKRHLSSLDNQVYKHPNHEKIIKQGDIGSHFMCSYKVVLKFIEGIVSQPRSLTSNPETYSEKLAIFPNEHALQALLPVETMSLH